MRVGWCGKVIAGLEITRPLNGLIASGSVLIGALLSGRGITDSVWIAALSCFLITGGGNTINDVADQEIDRINKPGRPIPSERLSGKGALGISISLFIIGIVIAGLVSFWLIEMAALATALLLVYSFSLKRKGLRGNMAVSFLGGLPFVYGGVASKCITPTIIPFFFAFLFHLLRELIKDIEDMEGDRGQALTFPIVYGVKKTLKLTNSILILLILYTLFPYIAGIYGIPYIIAVFILFDVPLVVVAALINRNRITYGLVSKILKLLIPGALCSLLLAAL